MFVDLLNTCFFSFEESLISKAGTTKDVHSKEGAIPWLMSSFLSRFAISTDIHGLAGDVPRFENISGKAEHFEEKEKNLAGNQSRKKLS
jgi:hypothetical protein